MDDFSSFPHQNSNPHPSTQSTAQFLQHASYAIPSSIPGSGPSLPNLDLDASIPSEYDLISQSPEDRAVLLELLRERRRVKEIELRILEEKRREREANVVAAAATATGVPGTTPAVRQWPPHQRPDVLSFERIGLSALGASNVTPQSGPPDFVHSQPRQPHQQIHQPHIPSQHSYHLPSAGYIYDPNALHHSPAAPSTTPSSLKSFDCIPSGLGLSSNATQQPQAPQPVSQPQDPYAAYPIQPARPSAAESPNSLHGSSPGSSAQQVPYPSSSSYAAAAIGLWDSPRGPNSSAIGGGMTVNTNINTSPPVRGLPSAAPSNYSAAPQTSSSTSSSSLLPSPPQPLPADLDLNPLHLYEDTTPHPGYAVSSGGSNYDEPSPPQGHFFPTPPPQHLQQSQLTQSGPYQHNSMHVKHQRLSDASSSTAGPSYVQTSHPSLQQGPPHVQTFPSISQPNTSVPVPQSPFTPISPNTTALSGANLSRKPKKLLLERQIACQTCGGQICKLLLRGTSEELSVSYEPFYECLTCISAPSGSSGQSQSPTAPIVGGYGSGGGGFTGSGLRMTRKRTRQTEDTSMPTVCDVCIRTIGRGGLVPQVRSTPLVFAVEVICVTCSQKYQRCSDCGGGSGRVGVGKWRAKELFENGRKTCKLPHVRVGGGELELSVWEIPWEIQNKKELTPLIAAVRTLWTERILARLAIPEVLEGGEEDWPSGSNSREPPVERTYNDVEEVISKGWPAREQLLLTAPSPNHDHYRRYLGLSWAKSRARRERAAGKLPDPAKYAEGNQDVLMENVRRTTVLVPPASTLVGMWIVDWDIRSRTILLSTSAPFETSDAEDKNIIGVGEVLTRVMLDLGRHNAEHKDTPLRPPQHIWVATRSISALGNARLNDTLTRRRGFVPVDEYVALHPGTDRTLFSSVPAGHTWIDEPPWIRHPESGELEVLVRWLGDEIDMERLDEIKDIEYGRKSKEMQIANRSKKPPAYPPKK